MSRKVEAALQLFSSMIKRHYGNRVLGLYRVNLDDDYEEYDRADAYIAVVLADGDWSVFEEVGVLGGYAYDALEQSDVFMRALPIAKADWDDPSRRGAEISAAAKAGATSLMEMASA